MPACSRQYSTEASVAAIPWLAGVVCHVCTYAVCLLLVAATADSAFLQLLMLTPAGSADLPCWRTLSAFLQTAFVQPPWLLHRAALPAAQISS